MSATNINTSVLSKWLNDKDICLQEKQNWTNESKRIRNIILLEGSPYLNNVENKSISTEELLINLLKNLRNEVDKIKFKTIPNVRYNISDQYFRYDNSNDNIQLNESLTNLKNIIDVNKNQQIDLMEIVKEIKRIVKQYKELLSIILKKEKDNVNLSKTQFKESVLILQNMEKYNSYYFMPEKTNSIINVPQQSPLLNLQQSNKTNESYFVPESRKLSGYESSTESSNYLDRSRSTLLPTTPDENSEKIIQDLRKQNEMYKQQFIEMTSKNENLNRLLNLKNETELNSQTIYDTINQINEALKRILFNYDPDIKYENLESALRIIDDIIQTQKNTLQDLSTSLLTFINQWKIIKTDLSNQDKLVLNGLILKYEELINNPKPYTKKHFLNVVQFLSESFNFIDKQLQDIVYELREKNISLSKRKLQSEKIAEEQKALKHKRREEIVSSTKQQNIESVINPEQLELSSHGTYPLVSSSNILDKNLQRKSTKKINSSSDSVYENLENPRTKSPFISSDSIIDTNTRQ